MSFIVQWIDFLWLPLMALAVHRGQRLWSMGFVLACAVMMRLQVELMYAIKYPRGILTLVDMPLLERGFYVTGIFYVLFILLARFSPSTTGVIFLAGSITLFFTAMVVSMLVMVL